MANRPRRIGGFSLIELLIVIVVIMIIVTIAIPHYQIAQMHARETAAIQAIHTVNAVQVQYQSQFGRYAASLTELGPPASGTMSAAGSQLIGNDLAYGVKQGYKFTLTPTPTGGYQITAVPEIYGSSGRRSFYSDQSMVLRVNDGPEPANAGSPESGLEPR